MSWLPDKEPDCINNPSGVSPVELLIEPKTRDIGDFSVRRVLPAAKRTMVGPFIFFDHMGPVEFPARKGMDVRPHPHIGLSTVTYMYQGSIMHRDSLGSEQLITPGAINWMTAGRGITHSERSSDEARQREDHLEGLQIWVALPKALEETAPAFVHHAADALPQYEVDGAKVRVLAGNFFDVSAPVKTLSDLFYVDVTLAAGKHFAIDKQYTERALYIIKGQLNLAGESYAAGRMLVLAPEKEVIVKAEDFTLFVVIGGEPLDGPRYVWWNFVSSSRERIEQAKEDWREGRFASVPGETEFIPLPER